MVAIRAMSWRRAKSKRSSKVRRRARRAAAVAVLEDRRHVRNWLKPMVGPEEPIRATMGPKAGVQAQERQRAIVRNVVVRRAASLPIITIPRRRNATADPMARVMVRGS